MTAAENRRLGWAGRRPGRERPRRRWGAGLARAGGTLLLILVGLAGGGLLGGCGGGSDDGPAAAFTLDVDALGERLMTELTYRDQLAELPPTVMYTLLGISPEDVLEQKNYFSSGATAEEIIVLRAADQAAAGRLSEALTARLAAQKATYASYAPAEVLYLDGAALAVKREYLAFCVAEDGEAAAALIQSALGE